MNLENTGPSTRAVHSGEAPDKQNRSLIPPLYQTSTFAFDNAKQGARLFAGQEEGYIYTRLGNPTLRVLEEKLAALEGGEDALVTSSGMGAISTALVGLTQAGDHVVSAVAIYGATYHLFHGLMSKFGLSFSFVDATKVENIRKAIQPNTRVIFIETPANPTLDITDIAATARLAKDSGATLIADNTFATFYNQLPLALGADLVVHSATKYINGHGDLVAGAIIGPRPVVQGLRRHSMELLGTCLGPFEAWLTTRGLRTMALRMARHNENGLAVARFLQGHPAVSRVHYPGLPEHLGHDIARKQMSGFGGMVSFELAGGLEAGETLVDSVKLCTLAVSLGSVETLIQHPASMTHAGVPPDVRRQMGITDGLVRLSVGIEDAPDIMADLGQALDALA